MATSLQLSSTQLNDLRALRDNAISRGNATGAWADFYQHLARVILTQPGLPNLGTSAITLGDVILARNFLPQDQFQSAIWLIGGAQVNSDTGAFSKVIRLYNLRQGQLRLGRDFNPTELQQASNEVGLRMAGQILNSPIDPINPGNGGKVPTVPEIGEADLSGVRFKLYPGNESIGSPLYLNQAWPGIIMLGKQGGNFLGRLVQSGDASKTDNLSDVQNLLFSWESFRYAFSQTGVLDISGAKDFAIALGITNWEDIPGAALNINEPKWWFDLLTANQDAGVAADLRIVHDIGSNKFLDMLMGAIQGKSLIGTTITDTNFKDNASAFFGALTPAQLQAINARLLPASASGLASEASANTADGASTRAALAALSVVRTGLSTAVADQFKLYDAATGQGITSHWIADRAAFTANYYAQQQRGGGILQGATNVAYVDKATGIGVLAGSGDAQRVQYQFGGDAADTLTGQGFADHLYGGAGADILNGRGGNDYLEGGIGNDTYQFDAGFGNDTLLDSDGQGTLTIGTTALTGGKKLSENLWVSLPKPASNW